MHSMEERGREGGEEELFEARPSVLPGTQSVVAKLILVVLSQERKEMRKSFIGGRRSTTRALARRDRVRVRT